MKLELEMFDQASNDANNWTVAFAISLAVSKILLYDIMIFKA